MSDEEGTAVLSELQKLQGLKPGQLKQVADILRLYTIRPYQINNIITAPSIEDAAQAYKLRQYRSNIKRYAYNPEQVQQFITQMQVKSYEIDADLSLNPKEQDRIWQDYQILMSHMLEKPIPYEIPGIPEGHTINALNDHQSQALYKNLKYRIHKGEHTHYNTLLLIALTAEGIYRTTNKFPRCTQILTTLKYLQYPGNVIHEVKTGEGKSIISPLFVVLLYSFDKTIDLVTENEQLAKQALTEFRPLFEYFEIPCGDKIIYPQSEYEEYIPNGINYSTASNLALFRTRMALEKKPLPANTALIADEIDALLTSTVQYRLATSLNPLMNDISSWSLVYQYILDFVNEKELYRNNLCSQEEDVNNLKNYLIIKNAKQSFLSFINNIPDTQLNELIESAVIATQLEENVDYYVTKIKKANNTYHYAAPIIASTNRPDVKVSYSNDVQQLLHTLLNNKKPKPTYPFQIEQRTDALVVLSAKNFFDYYRLKKQPIIGLTATTGSLVERSEFFAQQGLVAFKYPTFHPDRSEDLGLIPAFGELDHRNKLHHWITTRKLHKPKQPILIITSSPQVTEQFANFLAKNTTWTLQSFHGYAPEEKSEENVIYTASKEDCLTIANQSLARGADIKPQYEFGLLVINTCTDVTLSELIQIYGRASRDGKPGQYISIIDAQLFASPGDSIDNIKAAFKTHQHSISIKRQQERHKMRLLHEVRFILIDKYILQFRELADAYYTTQYGEKNSIVSHKNLVTALYALNQNAESDYAKLLELHPTLDEDAKKSFLIARVSDHQQTLMSWLPPSTSDASQFIEPAISLENLSALLPQLKAINVAQLAAFTDIFHRQWLLDGHIATQNNLIGIEQFLTYLTPYLQHQSNFKNSVGVYLEERGFFELNRLSTLKHSVTVRFNELLAYASSIAVLGNFVPERDLKASLRNYMNTTELHIQNKEYDKISVPTFDLSGISNWYNSIANTLSVGSLVLGGPIPFVVNRYILPSILSLAKNALKTKYSKSESDVAQIFMGLDTISDDVINAINVILAMPETKELTVGILLDNLGPFFKNKALLVFFTKYLEATAMQEYIPYLDVIPELLLKLEAYRSLTPRDLLQSNTLITLWQQLSSNKAFIQLFEGTPYANSMVCISQLNPDFIAIMGKLSLKELLTLLKITAHPRFFNLLSKLPKETNYEEMCQWITDIPEHLLPDTKEAIKELVYYQSHSEIIALRNKEALVQICKTHTLSLDILESELKKLEPKPLIASKEVNIGKSNSTIPDENSPILEKVQPPRFFEFKDALTLLTLASLIAFSLTHFSIPIAVVSVILGAWVVYPYVKRIVSGLFHTLSPKTEAFDEVRLNNQSKIRPKNEGNLSNNHSVIKKNHSAYPFFGPSNEDKQSKENNTIENTLRKQNP